MTEQIEFTALVDEKYPDGYVQRGIEFPLCSAWLHNIYYGEAAFEVVSTLKKTSVQISPENLNKRYPSILTFYPGISRLVIQNDEVKPNDHETAASPRQMKDAVREAAERGRSNF